MGLKKKKKCIYFFNPEIFELKGVLGVGFLEKHQSEANKFWRASKQGSSIPVYRL